MVWLPQRGQKESAALLDSRSSFALLIMWSPKLSSCSMTSMMQAISGLGVTSMWASVATPREMSWRSGGKALAVFCSRYRFSSGSVPPRNGRQPGNSAGCLDAAARCS